MSNVVALSEYTTKQISTIKRTVAKDSNDLEFDLFMEAAKSYGLDPFRKQIVSVVFSKNDPEKRQQAIIVSRDGLRVIASRCKDYRPASEKADIEIDKDLIGPDNPKGIVSATVKLWKQDNNGDWFPVIGEAYWDEFADVKDEWAFDESKGRRAPTGKKSVNGNWQKMPVVMITKCAESQALRAGWPDQFGGVYSQEEMEKTISNETASEMLHAHSEQERLSKVGGHKITFQLDANSPLESIDGGAVHDRLDEYLTGKSPDEIYQFATMNAEALRQAWATDPSGLLEIKSKHIEPAKKKVAMSSESKGA